MELMAGFSVAVGSSLLEATSLQYGMFWLFLLAGAGGILIALAVAFVAPPDPWDRIALVLGGAIVALVIARFASSSAVSFLASTVLLGVAYWRGATITQEPADYAEVQARFGLGFGVLFTGLVWIVARGVIYRPLIWHMLALDGIAYTIVAMTALVLARVDRTREVGATQAIVLAVAMQLGLLALVGVGALVVFSHDLSGALFNLTRPIWDAVGPLWVLFLQAVFTPIEWIIAFLQHHAHAQPHRITLPPPEFYPHGNARRHLATQRPARDAAAIAALVVVLALMAFIGWLIWYTIPRVHRPRLERGFTEVRRNNFSLQAIWNSLLRLLRGLMRGGSDVAEAAVTSVRRRVFGPEYPEDPIRRLYAQMLYRAARLGIPRAASCTPREFQLVLCATWPEHAGDFVALTDAYVRRRYGEATFASEEVASLRARWAAVRQLMRRQPLALAEPLPQSSSLATVTTQEAPTAWWRSLLHTIWNADTVRKLAVDFSGALAAVVVIFLFVIGMVVVAIVLSSGK
jgi:hypothetical protein